MITVSSNFFLGAGLPFKKKRVFILLRFFWEFILEYIVFYFIGILF